MAAVPALQAASQLACGVSQSTCLRQSSGVVTGTKESVFVPVFQWGQSLASSAATSRRSRRGGAGKRAAVVMAKKQPERDPNYPWPDKYDTSENSFLSFLSGKFSGQPENKKPVSLPFEKQVVELEQQLEEVRQSAKKTGMDFSEITDQLEAKIDSLRREIYTRLTPVQRLSVARHPNRPTFLDHVLNITDKWVELHGDRGGYDDPALVTGIGKIDNMSFMLMGHQKGRNTKENIYRNFGMPTPNGYRKALRMMRHAEHHGLPILTFIDTPGAYAGVSAEELGQGEAIAHNLRDMFGIKVPIVTTVIGEGGSGGALAIGCCDRMLMLENAVYYVASPEACAAILWKTASAAPKATEMLRITGYELQKLNVVDEVIPEPVGGAHGNPLAASANMKEAILRHMTELLALDWPELQAGRLGKFRQMGTVNDTGGKGNDYIKRSMKPRDAPPDRLPFPKPLPLPEAVKRLYAEQSSNGKQHNGALLESSSPVNTVAR